MTLFAIDPQAVTRHVHAGGSAVTIKGAGNPRIVYVNRGIEADIMAVGDIPATMGGGVPFMVANVLAATALAIAVGVAPTAISAALSRIDLSGSSIPGRFRHIQGFPFEVFIDRGTSPASLAGFFGGIGAFRRPGSVIRVMLTAVGNRKDAYFDQMAEIARDAGVSTFVLYDSEHVRRGRRPGEIPQRISDWLISHGVSEERVAIVDDPRAAVVRMISDSTAGDILCFLGDTRDQDLASAVLTELRRAGWTTRSAGGR